MAQVHVWHGDWEKNVSGYFERGYWKKSARYNPER